MALHEPPVAVEKQMRLETMECNWRVTSRTARLRMAPERVHEFLTELFAEDVHAARVLSLSNAVSGAIQAAASSVHAIANITTTVPRTRMVDAKNIVRPRSRQPDVVRHTQSTLTA